MSCQDNYLSLNRDITSRSGLYASDLPGVEDLLVTLISKDSETDTDVWERIYRNAWTNMVSDVEAALQDKFFVNQKLVSRETSEFIADINANTGLAGVRIQFDLPRYARIHIVSVGLWANQAYPSPEPVIYFYEDNDAGDLLHSVSEAVIEGKNTVFVDRDFDEEKIFVGYDPALFEFRGTEMKFFNTGWPNWSKFECMWPCFGGQGSVKQINGGGLNIIYNVICSAEKFVCENINLFRKTLWWRIGEELAAERRIGNRLNQFTTMTDERKTELANFYGAQYQQALKNSIKAHNIYEDPYCFNCKGTVNVTTNLP